jgi:small ligand-binding sensory domain FIST
MNELRFAAALSTEPDTRAALEEVCRTVCERLRGPSDLAVVFASHHHLPGFESLAGRICDALETDRLLGCTGESIVGGGREIEGRPAVSLWAGRLPGVSVDPMHLQFMQTAEGGTFTGWPEGLSDQWPAGAALLLLAEPFTFPADQLLARLNEDQPGVPVLGGMASGAARPGENRLVLGRRQFADGAVAALIHGALSVRSVVSQGCRPIGRHLLVTKADQNVILELSGKPALAQLRELFAELSPRDQALIQHGLHVGCVINEMQGEFGRGDFLVRNVIGADPQSGAVAIGDYVRRGQTVQFHVRDEETADEDLRALLSSAATRGASTPAGALLFTCNGRGTRLFSRPDHDASVVQETWSEVPLAGFFAQGEIGPIGGKNFLHGFTASVALFGEAGAR